MSTEALKIHLSLFSVLFDDEEITEIIVNQPGEIWYEKNGEFTMIDCPALTFGHLRGLADLTATYNHSAISSDHPLLSGTLPDGSRVQFVIPPACSDGHVYLVIRRQRILDLTLEDFEQDGIFDIPVSLHSDDPDPFDALRSMQVKNDVSGIIRFAMKNKITMMISGACATGKTALLNTCLKYMPVTDRLVCIEDCREVKPPHRNVAFLLFNRGGKGVSGIGAQELLEATLRLRPDRVVFQEIRGSDEAAAFLRAINSGHHGSVATVHANTAKLAYQQIALMVMQSGMSLTMDQIVLYVKGLIPIVIQYNFVNGKRKITEIYINEER